VFNPYEKKEVNMSLHITNKIWIFIIMMLLAFIMSDHLPGQNKLKYEVRVESIIVPVFAIDAKGNPVNDLNKDDLEFFVNGKTIDFHFFPIQFTYETENQTITHKAAKNMPLKRPRNRVIIFIVDTMFNSKMGLRRSQDIIKKMLSENFKNDTCLIFENSPGGGIRLIAGPEKNKAIIIKGMSSLRVQPEKYKQFLFKDPDDPTLPEFLKNPIDKGPVDPKFQAMVNNIEDLEKARYKYAARRFGYAISKFKYILKTVKEPKLIFLISEGIAKGALYKNYKSSLPSSGSALSSLMANPSPGTSSRLNPFLFKYFKRISRAVNAGGTVLYTINPQPVTITTMLDTFNSGEISLKYLASESGGRYFAGQDVSSISREIKKTTAAYYEISFAITPEMGSTYNLDIRSKREGITVFSPHISEKMINYDEMGFTEKKIYALDVAIGGGWSRTVGKTQIVAHQCIKSRQRKNKIIGTYEINLPDHMKNKPIDIFVLTKDKNNQIYIAKNYTQKAKDNLKIKINHKKETGFSFVIIEPSTTSSIYGGEKMIRRY
jgi:VWFA-related protein